FDELTDADMQPVKAVAVPGSAPQKTQKAAGEATPNPLLGDASNPATSSGSVGDGVTRPGLLYLIAFLNFLAAGGSFLGALAVMGASAFLMTVWEDVGDPTELTAVVGIIIGVFVFSGVLALATAICAIVQNAKCWYLLLFSYAWGAAEKIFKGGDLLLGEGGFELREMGKLILPLVVGIGFWVAIHGKDVQAFYGIQPSDRKKMIITDVAGFLVGSIMGVALILLS
ncbi:MAG: hypothetical protein AAF664_20060, partial [Planctomycetota bacterium]